MSPSFMMRCSTVAIDLFLPRAVGRLAAATARRACGLPSPALGLALIAASVLVGCQPAGNVPATDAAPDAANAAPAAAAPPTYQVPPNYAATPAPAQPLPFSHAAHAGMIGLPCANCHVGAGPAAAGDERTAGGAHMTLPESSVCMACHEGVAADRPAIRKLAEYHDSGQPVPWIRVYRVMQGVNWSHKPHVESGMTCDICHGDVTKMEMVSMATAVTAMSSCIGCHRSGQASPDCVTCHSWPRAEDL